MISHVSMYKGWAFVGATSLLLLGLVIRKLNRQSYLHRQLETRRIDLEEFLYATSHHLKTPLVTLHGYSAELTHELQSETLDREAIETIGNRLLVATAQMDEILRNITHLHRSLRSNPRPLRISTHARIQKVIHEAKRLNPDSSGAISIEALPECYLDGEHFDVIIREIVSNFFRHCKELPNPTLSISLLQKSQTSITIQFLDNGPGFSVPPDNTLFHPALRKQSQQDMAGLRIGLAIAWRCAKWNGGNLQIYSAKGSSTRVELTLPTGHPTN